MATGQSMVTRTLRLLGVLADGQSPTAQQLSDGLDSMNEMLSAWRDQGVDLGHSTISAGDTIPYQDDHLPAIRYSLAIEIAPEYGRSVPGEIIANQQKYFKGLQALYCNPPLLSVDRMLQPYYTHPSYTGMRNN
jgi:hypothetical protein